MSQTQSDSSAALFAEDTWFEGVLLTFVAYGSTVTLAIQCFFMLLSRPMRARMHTQVPLVVFTLLVFMLSTIFIGAANAIVLAPQAIINNPNIAQGLEYYEQTHWSMHINVLANATLMTLCLLADMLLLWRCIVVYQSMFISQWYGITMASVFWITEFVIGALFMYQSSRPLGTLWSSINFNLAFWSLSLAVNILGTNLIVGRILYCRYRAWRAFKHTSDSQYTSVVAMLVESELLYTSFLILYIVLFGIDNPLEATFSQPMILVQTTAALMIVYRVAQGTAWSKNTFSDITGSGVVSTVQFDHDAARGTTDSTSDAAEIVIEKDLHNEKTGDELVGGLGEESV
ncbi:hypothetical protein NM688_g419 [Phlebia brevispora]|uniref:Uncharacterized protein n=1 Tax=Phlebia brevispora TaxID=194682 RepID=A0ACC1TEJ5_9APHY|nr:hypothetical protein NM688_g419 [Phlebia brevispora]